MLKSLQNNVSSRVIAKRNNPSPTLFDTIKI